MGGQPRDSKDDLSCPGVVLDFFYSSLSEFSLLGLSGAASASVWDSLPKLSMDFNACDSLPLETDVSLQ